MDDFDGINKLQAEDFVVSIAKAFLGLVPGSSFLTEYWGAFLGSPLENRRNEFFKQLHERVVDLENNRGLDIEALKTNDTFIDAILQIAPLYQSTSEELKKEAFKNILTNLALDYPIEDIKSKYFIRLIGSMSDGHIIVLNFLHQPESWLRSNGGNRFIKAGNYYREMTIAAIFNECKPGLFANYTLVLILEELVANRLIISQNAEGFLTTPYSFGAEGTIFTNERGRDFLNFITYEK